MKYILGQELKGYQYKDICHGKGCTIWHIIGNKLFKHISKGTILDNHCHLVKDVDMDTIWRGRYHNGNVIVMPPNEIYHSSNVKLPTRIFNRIYGEFSPIAVYIELSGRYLINIIKH
jgi:hypothetical protein